MFGTTEEPGLIPKCLQRIFLRADDHIDKQLLFKPDGLENLMPTTQGDLSTEIAVREYIFPDQEVNQLMRETFFFECSQPSSDGIVW